MGGEDIEVAIAKSLPDKLSNYCVARSRMNASSGMVHTGLLIMPFNFVGNFQTTYR